MEYKQHKTLEQGFWRLNLSEGDLCRLAGTMMSANSKEPLEIEVRSADGQDSFSSGDPEFFLSRDMPTDVSAVEVATGDRFRSPVSCMLILVAGPKGQANLKAFGADAKAVSGLFHELLRDLESRQQPGIWLAERAGGLLVFLLLGLVCSLATYALFDITLTLATQAIPGFALSPTYNVVATVRWLCVSIAVWSGGFLLQDRLKALVPAVSFSGRLSDPNGRRRAATLRVFLLILLPIVLNVLANFAAAILNRWRAG